ncbi:MAG TPA: flagellar biosynthesis protein FlhF [Clostridiales bacterium]|nr:flagellar biosynthesis protein FlhF [Clostridiales bacterium]
MKIKRYVGNDLQETILKVKMDMGNDALIVSNRNIREKGFLKLFSKPMVEVIAALDEPDNRQKEFQLKNSIDNTLKMPAKADENKLKFSDAGRKIQILESRFSNMEETLQKIYLQMQKLPIDGEANKISNKKQNGNSVMQLFYNNLIKNEVEEEIAKQLVENAYIELEGKNSVNDFISVLYNNISEIIGSPGTINLKENGKPTVVTFTGPTGVGKTTTIAKIAAIYSLEHSKKVSLITADTYRVAAVEQLKTYADILSIPLTTVYSANDIKKAIKTYSDKDIILIDTAGRSHKDSTHFEELKNLINATEADETYLVLSMTISAGNCRKVLNSYGFLDDYKLIFTKYDESSTPGIILNTAFYTKKHLSYITTGQSVPDDIMVCNLDEIIKKMIGNFS